MRQISILNFFTHARPDEQFTCELSKNVSGNAPETNFSNLQISSYENTGQVYPYKPLQTRTVCPIYCGFNVSATRKSARSGTTCRAERRHRRTISPSLCHLVSREGFTIVQSSQLCITTRPCPTLSLEICGECLRNIPAIHWKGNDRNDSGPKQTCDIF